MYFLMEKVDSIAMLVYRRVYTYMDIYIYV